MQYRLRPRLRSLHPKSRRNEMRRVNTSRRALMNSILAMMLPIVADSQHRHSAAEGEGLRVRNRCESNFGTDDPRDFLEEMSGPVVESTS